MNLEKKKFMKQTEDAIEAYSKENINEQSLIRALANYDLYQKQFNTFFEYLKDWYSLHNSQKYDELKKDSYKFVKYLCDSEVNQLEKDTFLSSGLQKDDLTQIKSLATTLIAIYSNASKIENFLTKKSKDLYPNLTNILSPLLTVRFLNQAHSLKRLSSLPASTLQLFGAENAMFKHLKFGKDSPKYGLLYLHPLMSALSPKQKGKLARTMADKISLASRYDYAKKPLHKELLEDIEAKKKSILAEREKPRAIRPTKVDPKKRFDKRR
jgi:nucleolar protein 56